MINGRFKLNFDGSRINNISALGWVIRDSNGIIALAGSRNLDNVSIVIAKCVALRDGVLVSIYNGFTNLEIEKDFIVTIYCYNRSSSSSLIILLMEDIWRLSQNFKIYNCGHIYIEVNRTIDCLAKKKVSIILIVLYRMKKGRERLREQRDNFKGHFSLYLSLSGIIYIYI